MRRRSLHSLDNLLSRSSKNSFLSSESLLHSNQFRFAFEFIRSNEPINDRIKGDLTRDDISVPEIPDKKGRCPKSELTEKVNESVSTVHRVIKSLKEKSLIERTGSNKTGYRTTIL